MLYTFAGLPGTGKTTLARLLARDLKAVFLRIDTIEQALRESGGLDVGPEGYFVAYRLAAENLRLDLSVVADSVNPLQVTRSAWRDVAAVASVPHVEIEVVCSDSAEHRARVESRTADIPGHRLPTWAEVLSREYEPWDRTLLRLDTAGRTIAETYAELVAALVRVQPFTPSAPPPFPR